MSMFRTSFLSVVAVLLTVSLARPAAAVIAYEVPFGLSGNQNFGGPVGMEFNVNAPITITQLGVFDDDSNGLASPITAYLYNRAAGNTAVPIAQLVFPAGTPGTLVGGSRFLDLPVPLQLPAGFQGVIVASGYNATDNVGNQGVGPIAGLTTNSGGGLLSFVGTGRWGPTAGAFPPNVDTGAFANRYAGGTFNFTAADLPSFAVPLQNATAIHSQPNFTVDLAINGVIAPDAQFGGWANGGPVTAPGQVDNTAVFETVTDIVGSGGANLQFSLVSGGFNGHTVGRFRLSVTGDDRSTFADGLTSGGDVTANWTVLDIDSVMSTNPNTTFTELADGSILAGGALVNTETYLLNAHTSLTKITGFRLEMIEDPSLPSNGPGRNVLSAPGGNYVLLEFSVTAQAVIIPEPASAMLLLVGVAGLVARRRRAA